MAERLGAGLKYLPCLDDDILQDSIRYGELLGAPIALPNSPSSRRNMAERPSTSTDVHA